MPLRKRTNKDAPSESQHIDQGTEGDEDLGDRDRVKDDHSASLLSSVSSRERRRRERVKGKKAKDMSEQEMMDLALHLSEQEASDSALRRQQEEEAVTNAIQASMASQTQACRSPQSQSLLTEADASITPCHQRKPWQKTMASTADRGDLDICASERNQSQTTEAMEETNSRIRKRKIREDNLLLDLPGLPQTKKICSQSSPYGSGSLPVFFDTGQSCDSTQVDDCQLQKSPVFPLTGSKAEVHVSRLSQGLVDTCRSSGFVLCSQDNSKTTNSSPPTQPRSPTFPQSPRNPPLSQSTVACPKSPVFSETDPADDAETQISPEYIKSPVFGRTTQQDSSSRACKSQASVRSPSKDISGFIYSSQESFTSSVGPASCRPKSPVFPRTPSLPNNHAPLECSEIPQSSVFLDEDEKHEKRTAGPMLDKTFRPQKVERDRIPTLCRGSPIAFEEIEQQSQLRQGDKIKTNTSLQSDDAEELSRDLSERELTSDMTLHWSDDDEDMTVMGSPSPVFPKESPVEQAAGRGASLPHVGADVLETDEPNRSLDDQSCVSSQSLLTSTSAPGHTQQLSTPQATCQAGASASRPTVHYYWGVPFCPRGLQADTYTQVILAQMEVYEKSLKQAQRRLLRKAEWGEGILPQPEKPPSPESPAERSPRPVPQRRGLRLRGKKLSEEADSPPVESEEDEAGKGKGEDKKRRENKVGRNESDGSIQLVDPDDCAVCPETQLSDDSTQDLTMCIEDEPQSTKEPDVEMILQEDNSVVDDSQNEREIEDDVDKGLEGLDAINSLEEGRFRTTEQQDEEEEEEEARKDLDVEEIAEREFQRSTSPELGPVAVPPSPESNVECPICQGYFPAAKIEMHAAYCDGEVAVLSKKVPEPPSCLQGTSKARRTRIRRASEEENDTSNNLEILEKCCTCQKSFPLRVYSRHKELCTTSNTPSKIDEVSAMGQREDTDAEVSLSRGVLMKRRRWGVTGLRDSKSDTQPSDHSLQSQKSPVAMVTSEGSGQRRRQVHYTDGDSWRGIRMKGKKLMGEPTSQPSESGEEEEEEQGGQEITEEGKIVKESGPRPQLKSLWQPEVEVTIEDKNAAGEEEEEEEVNATVDRRVRGDSPAEIKERELPRPSSPELHPAAVSPSPDTNVNCPICQGSFPVAKIEMHAAYCDGELAVVNKRKTEASQPQVSSKSRRPRTRRAAEEANSTSNNSEHLEKCYVCQTLIPLQLYSRHTEVCTQKCTSKSAWRGNLLSALKQTESMDSGAGPSWSKATAGEIIELQDDDDEEEEMLGEGASRFKISNSPIRSFTPISEATDCLIDFKRQQRAKKPSQRRK